jgi:phosphoribosylformimino-5-aminoimidazole carboxamide ribotide isomerase
VEENFTSHLPPSHYAQLYQQDGLRGGHVILLGPNNEQAALQALETWPGGLQVGGGVTDANALDWIQRGASHVIVTSYLFPSDSLDWERLERLSALVQKEKLVIDLSCRKRDNDYYVMTNKWQTWTDTKITVQLLERLSQYCDEFLIHAVDVEGKQSGIQQDLVEFLGRLPYKVTYAGGVRSLEDLDLVERLGQGNVDVTVGSALDIFGGKLPYREVVEWHKKRNPE